MQSFDLRSFLFFLANINSKLRRLYPFQVKHLLADPLTQDASDVHAKCVYMCVQV